MNSQNDENKKLNFKQVHCNCHINFAYIQYNKNNCTKYDKKCLPFDISPPGVNNISYTILNIQYPSHLH